MGEEEIHVTAAVALQATDVQAFMNLPAIAAHAAERAAGPRFARRADEELFLRALFVERVVGGGEKKKIRRRSGGDESQDESREQPEETQPHFFDSFTRLPSSRATFRRPLTISSHSALVACVPVVAVRYGIRRPACIWSMRISPSSPTVTLRIEN